MVLGAEGPGKLAYLLHKPHESAFEAPLGVARAVGLVDDALELVDSQVLTRFPACRPQLFPRTPPEGLQERIQPASREPDRWA